MTTVAVMRLLENGNAATYSAFYLEVQQYASSQGLPVKGGYLLDGCNYVYKHPEDRIKRRIFDIDEEAEKCRSAQSNFANKTVAQHVSEKKI